MNKLIIENGIIKEKVIDTTIKFDYNVSVSFFSVNNLEIECLEDTDLYIYYLNMADIKINATINCLNGANINVYEIYSGGVIKIRNIYNLDKESKLNIQKIYDIEKIKQFDIVNLNGSKAEVNYLLKTVSTNEEKYNLLINHNAVSTISNVINNAVNINDGKVVFDVNGIVPHGMIDSILNQNNRIVTFNQNKCQINPNLLIDENAVSANHSAFIGKFGDEEIFYLQSRGIAYDEVLKLLIRGFLYSNVKTCNQVNDELELIIKKYWG